MLYKVIKGCVALVLGGSVFGLLALAVHTGSPMTLRHSVSFYYYIYILGEPGALVPPGTIMIAVFTIFSVMAAALMVILGVLMLSGFRPWKIERVFFIGMIIAGGVVLVTGLIGIIEALTQEGLGEELQPSVGIGGILLATIGGTCIIFAFISKFVLRKKIKDEDIGF